MPTIAELSDSELLMKYDKLNDYLELIKKEMKKRGLRKSLSDSILSYLESSDVKVSRPNKITTTIRKAEPPSGVMEVVSDSDSDVTIKTSTSKTAKPKKLPLKKKPTKKAVSPPKPPKSAKSTAKTAKSTAKTATKTNKRAVDKATVVEIKAVLERNGVTFKSRDTKKVLLELASKNNLIRTIEYYHNANSTPAK